VTSEQGKITLEENTNMGAHTETVDSIDEVVKMAQNMLSLITLECEYSAVPYQSK